MKFHYFTLSRKAKASLAAAVMLFAVGGTAKAGLNEQISQFAAQANSRGASAPAPVSPMIVAPVTKFSATGRINESLASGPCAGNPIVSSCTNCDALTISGQVNATALGKSTLNACLTVDNSAFDTNTGGLPVCFNGLGTGAITAANGNAVNIGFGGLLCIADENIAAVTIDLTTNLTYVVEGGVGPFSSAKGSGNLATSFVVVNPSSTLAGTGQVTMNGSLSKN